MNTEYRKQDPADHQNALRSEMGGELFFEDDVPVCGFAAYIRMDMILFSGTVLFYRRENKEEMI